VNLRWDAEFTKPFGKNGFSHSFRFFVFHWCDDCYLQKASVMHRMYLCWRPAASIGPKRSAWMRMFGCSGVGSGCSGGGLSVDDLRR